jgi:hypothetical protein
MSFAAYNAGAGRVQGWAKTYGDPRGGDVDAVDWIEHIPFDETRDYVKRTLENLQVYRARLGVSELRLEADLTGRSGQWLDPLAAGGPKEVLAIVPKPAESAIAASAGDRDRAVTVDRDGVRSERHVAVVDAPAAPKAATRPVAKTPATAVTRSKRLSRPPPKAARRLKIK